MTTEFRAAVLERIGAPVRVLTLSAGAPSFGQVLVRIHKSGICGAQMNEIRGTKGPDKFLPHLLGHEGAGIVHAIGDGVTKVKEGDRVVVHWRKGAGVEGRFPSYTCDGRRIGGGHNTTFNEFALVSENRLTKLDVDIPFEIGALLGCGITTGFGIVNNDIQLATGESIVVFGAGGVGLNVIQAAACASAMPIIAVDIVSGQKRDLALRMGATHFVETSSPDAIRAIVPSGANACVDTTGNIGVINDAFECLDPDGKLILVGQPRFDLALTLNRPLRFFDGPRTIFASNGGGTRPERDIPRLCKMYRAGRVDFGSLITHRFSLNDVNEALQTTASGLCGRVILDL